ncbi:MAG TPA: hypothetical protein VEJ18_09115, partial [Planctomycetota bacterium]|nr:hypothetical protein [Planctomycetota bacterium]
RDGLSKDYIGGEAEHVPSPGGEVEAAAGQKVSWQAYDAPAKRVNFFHVPELGFQGKMAPNVACYAACWVEATEDVEVVVRLGSDDGYRLWLDHQELGASTQLRPFQWDSNLHKVKLTKGRHLLMLKVFSNTMGFEFALRLTTPNLEVPRGIRVWN